MDSVASWAEFLIDCFKVHGIGAANKVLITTTHKSDATSNTPKKRGHMLVKKWLFFINGTAARHPFTHYRNQIIDLKGVAGQGNDNPYSEFYNHFIVKYNNKYYDPSYGGGVYDTQEEWEDASLAGFLVYKKNIVFHCHHLQLSI